MDGPLYFSTRAHLLLCTGPRCAHQGSVRVYNRALSELETRSLAYYKRGGTIRLTESGCLGACSHGPTLAAYHGDGGGRLQEAWYVGVDVDRLLRVAHALHEGDPLPEDGRFGPR